MNNLSKLNLKDNLPIRSEGYTTNGSWAILSEFEPKKMQLLQSHVDKPQFNPVFSKINLAEYTKVKPENLYCKTTDKYFAQKLTDGNGTTQWVNSNYLDLFTLHSIQIYATEDVHDPILIFDDNSDYILGLLMAIQL